VGITDSSIKVAVILVDLGAANATFDLPSFDDQVKAYEALWDRVNAAGGLQCRQVKASYYHDNIIDPSQEHAACLQIEQDRPFAVINNLYNPQELGCIAQRKIPNFWFTPPLTSDVKASSPYILSREPDYDRLIRSYILGADKVGWFDGAGKVGLLETSCYPEQHDAAMGALSAAHIDPKTVEIFDYGCDTSLAASTAYLGGPGAADQQAVVQFKSANVTHALNIGYTKVINFSRAADNQGYRPRFALMNDALFATIEGAKTPAGNSLDGALGITTHADGARNSPGVPFSAATDECEKVMHSIGLASPKDRGNEATLFGNACNQVQLFAAAAGRSPGLKRAGLSAGLVKVGYMEFSSPGGRAKFTDPARPTGGQYWRTESYHHDCNCFKILDATWRNAYG
jgi:hypothetical protein